MVFYSQAEKKTNRKVGEGKKGFHRKAPQIGNVSEGTECFKENSSAALPSGCLNGRMVGQGQDPFYSLSLALYFT